MIFSPAPCYIAEARRAIAKGVSAVIDLTGEMSEAEPFLALPCLNLQILDLTAPLAEQIDRAIEFVAKQSKTGAVYIHCKAGYSRTGAVAGAYLLATGHAASAEQAIAMLRAARPAIVLRPEALATIRQVEESRIEPANAMK